MMAKTANLTARIEPDIKDQAETILNTLGIPASNAINMFYKQIILQQGIPFDLKLPSSAVLNVSTLTEDEMNNELEKGYNQMLAGKGQSADQVFTSIRQDYHL
ncbi:type II toxin-antitoxin system RelB/DinJ family antitoxin (plasmid) [Leuconostoc carnosum]|uniref:Type II toxin-antitoxin system RelB/DinJ family antitoxin n=2 Tax=Leuconostoc TaxID=1243 RepID=A0AAE6IJS3_LEUCA|nr:type II toxin-antitoxin system RelB/DinJ family antitoxin [Leuconostoc mesenteroides]QEA34164.1 type II toxin-antitoxin system RelB/DinJ family antitoxin [Leuconostoc carnosum]